MSGQSVCRYSSAKFIALGDSESVASAKRNYLSCIISVTILFGVATGFLCYKIFISPPNSDTHPQTINEEEPSFVSRTPKGSVPFAQRKRIGQEQSEFLCERSHTNLEAVPSSLKEKIFQEPQFENINADLLLHYESIINERSTEYLKLIFNKYHLELSAVRQSADFLNFLARSESNKLKFYSEFLSKNNFKLNFENFNWIFQLTEELNQWYNYLDRLSGFLSDYDQQKRRNYFVEITDFNFSTFTSETHRKLFHFDYPFIVTEKKLNEINKVINDWMQPVEAHYDGCTVTIVSRALLLSEAKEQLLALDGFCLKNVYIYASRVLYLDTHLELFGTNLGIVSPNWKFLKQIKINLDGVPGEGHAADTLSAGEAGKPGNPGGNAGDFIGIGQFQEKFLLVSANGGRGADGQNGAKGRDGLNNTRPYPRFHKPGCIIKINTFGNLFPAEMTHYEIYGEEGCGGPGGDGGVGGQGGRGGVITLIRKDFVEVKGGVTGATGRPGQGGPGGAGGRNGCFYEAVDDNNQFLHPVTTVKCPSGTTLPSGEFGKDNSNTWGQQFPPKKEPLAVHDCIFNYIRLTKEHLIKHDDAQVVLFLKDFKETKMEDIIKTFKLIEGLQRFEYFQFFKELLDRFRNPGNNETQLISNYLKSLVLGEMAYLQKNVNYFFVDINSYLNILETSTRSANESTGGLQAVSYFKRKVEIKIEEIAKNLRLLRADLEKIPEKTQKQRLHCILLITVDLINFLMYRSNELIKLELSDSLNFCSVSVKPIFKGQVQGLISGENDLVNVEKILLQALQTLFFDEKPVTEYLQQLRDALNLFKESEMVDENEKEMLEVLVTEFEHFQGLYDYIEWKDLEETFSKSLNNLNVHQNSSWSTDLEFLKSRLENIKVAVQFKLAENGLRQNLRPMPATTLQLPKFRTFDEIFSQLNSLKESRDESPFCRNHMKTVFERNSTVGQFFSWPNTQIKSKLKSLFSGAAINLKSNLINRHVLDKSFIQFELLKLDFDCPGKESGCEKLHEMLANFKMDVTHSGYSYYNRGDKTEVLVSEKVTLSYGFKALGNGTPELYNAFFKKCLDGEIKLSPFTSWTVRLSPLNGNADFRELEPFSEVVSLHLVGTGTYTL